MQKATFRRPFCTLDLMQLRHPNDDIIVCRRRCREKQSQHGCLRGVLGGRNCLRVDVHRCPQRGMPHQFLHHLELGSDTAEQRRVGESESVPADALLNVEGLGNWSNVFAKDGCAPVRPSSFVQAARKGPVFITRKLARLSPGQERISELRMERNRLLRGLCLACLLYTSPSPRD